MRNKVTPVDSREDENTIGSWQDFFAEADLYSASKEVILEAQALQERQPVRKARNPATRLYDSGTGKYHNKVLAIKELTNRPRSVLNDSQVQATSTIPRSGIESGGNLNFNDR